MARLAAQPALLAKGERLVAQVGASSAGMWLDQHTGSVVVGVVDEQAAATVRAAGATARVVEHSMTELESVRDAVAKRLPADSAAGIDARTNQVVVQIGDTASADALTATAARYGDAVTVRDVDGSFRTAISGGDAITGSGGRCSLGFSTTGNAGITAGHCTSAIASWNDPNGAFYGPSVGASFPGNDYGLIRNDGGLPQPGDVNLYNGSFQDITGAGDPQPGMQICKSGSTTGLTCGQVTQTGMTICYAQGCVNNMAESTAAVNPGDSGGALVRRLHRDRHHLRHGRWLQLLPAGDPGPEHVRRQRVLTLRSNRPAAHGNRAPPGAQPAPAPTTRRCTSSRYSLRSNGLWSVRDRLGTGPVTGS